MKRYLSIIALFYCMLAQAQSGRIKGNVVLEGKSGKNLQSEIVIDLVRKKSTVKAEMGNEFDFVSLPIDTFYIHIYDLLCLDTIIENIFVRPNETTELTITIPSSCEYDKSADNKECPICHKFDEAIPIVYGLIIIDDSRKKRKREEDQDFIAGGCKVTCCDPNWYCKRDQKFF